MPMVYGVCLKYLKDREDSRDAVMQLYEKLIETLKSHEVRNFRSWLYTSAKNHCLMHLRSKKGQHFEEFSAGHMENAGFLHLDGDFDMERNLSRLDKCIEILNQEQRQCVQLFYIQQKCYREITVITGYNDNQVKSFIQNGKRNLKNCMEQNG
jgi:RNA polymerase sigma-70 factor (ECF subfamily)